VAEAGFPDFEDYTWVGLFGPARLAPDIVQRLNAAIASMVAQSDVRDRLARAGMEPLPGTPAEFSAYLRREVAKWRSIVKQTGVSAE
jgi:tripartite-type tricarboxylate transporter receptor subunit TctC